MTKNKLTIPRFLVIEEYPKCEFFKGDILQRIFHATHNIYHIDINSDVDGIALRNIRKYPHLFKEMLWYEKRVA